MTTSTVVDFVHLLATVFWIGGMGFIKFVLEPSLLSLDPAQRGVLMGTVGKRFSIVAWVSVVLLLVTGLLKTPEGLLFDSTEGYALTLFLKHLAVLLMILIGLRISLGLVPRIQRDAPKAGERPTEGFLKTQKQFTLLSAANFILGLVVLLLVAMF